MDTIKLWAHNGDAVRQAIALGELVHLETACEELADEFLLFAIESGLLVRGPLSSKEAVPLAALQADWRLHPLRDQQHIAFVKGVEPLWEGCDVTLHACVMRYGNRLLLLHRRCADLRSRWLSQREALPRPGCSMP